MRLEAEVAADPLTAFEAVATALRRSELRLAPQAAGGAHAGEIVVWQPGRRLEVVLDETSSIAASFEPAGDGTRIGVELAGAGEAYERLWRDLLDGLSRSGG